MGMTNIELEVAHTTIRKNKAVADKLENIDWEQRRYEIAKDMACAILTQRSYNPSETALAKDAVFYANALITELKKET